MSGRIRGLGLLAAVILLGTGVLVASAAQATQLQDPASLLSQNHPVTASSSSTNFPAKNAVDGLSTTRWATRPGIDPQWIYVDLGDFFDISRVRLEWDKSCATAYRIETALVPTSWTTIFSTTTGDGGVDDLTVQGTARFVRVFATHRCRADASHGYSLREFQVFGTSIVPVQPPHNPRIIKVTCHSVEIGWDPPDPPFAAVDAFIDGQLRATVPGTATSVVLNGLAPNTDYGIYLVARDARGNVSAPTDPLLVHTPPCDDTQPPPPPTNVHTTQIGAACVALAWTPSTDPDVVEYRVYALQGGGRVALATTPDPSTTICGLTPHTAYVFVVTAVDSSGNESEPSSPPFHVVTAPPCEVAPVCRVDTVTTSTNVPWGLVTLPDGSILFTERESFNLVHADPAGTRAVVGHVPNVATTGGEGGLTGLEISPTFAGDHWLYFFHTTASDNRIVRIRYENGALNPASEQVLLQGIARNRFHNGGRLRFGPDGKLYAGTGDAQNGANAQNVNSLNGKILRLNPDGSVPPDNPYHNYVWSYGHRNVEGLAFDAQGRLWISELGDTRQDELDLVVKGGNYGWPACEGTISHSAGGCGTPGFIAPVRTFAPPAASPSGIAIVNNVIYMACLRGMRMYRMVITGSTTAPPTILFQGTFGRLRTVEPAPGGLWLTTSNGDGLDRTPVDRVLHVVLA